MLYKTTEGFQMVYDSPDYKKTDEVLKLKMDYLSNLLQIPDNLKDTRKIVSYFSFGIMDELGNLSGFNTKNKKE